MTQGVVGCARESENCWDGGNTDSFSVCSPSDRIKSQPFLEAKTGWLDSAIPAFESHTFKPPRPHYDCFKILQLSPWPGEKSVCPQVLILYFLENASKPLQELDTHSINSQTCLEHYQS